ncbi:M15 family metallopeptidase [Paenibacillus sp. NFR01]|uniref:M15 family metallopeptidase n=1 Tax=Paenibacillus sp. NFR01 TaxID=1566279 RepID=UPI0008C7593F|nr:M15 family metallopeptidase [Paenibacillus sp. NFR01]SEU26518.1 peptidoglycan L-alanyl-D-glutamate endopeptidase CwlK [Paenibacillus sp. NFR01]
MPLTIEKIQAKSAVRLIGLHPVLSAAVRRLIDRCFAKGVPILITQGMRTAAEQDKLYAQGRTQTELDAAGVSKVKARPDLPKVTNARSGYSYHNYGLAVDFALLLPDGTGVSWDMKRDGDGDRTVDWTEVVQEAKALGMEWGGDWSSFKDYPHLQMCLGLSLAELRSGAKPSDAAVEAAYRIMNAKEEQLVKCEMTNPIKVNGVKIADGFIEDGVTYAPVRAVAEALGANVGYVAAEQTVEIVTGK